jgi:Ser/Thr protein kinase RdoA (MazF antagonist)
MVLEVAYSTVAPTAVVRVAEQAYAIGPVTGCRLLHRGFNDVYELECEGTTYFGRVSVYRARGRANVAYETAFMAHLNRIGVDVATPVAARDGSLWTELEAPDGRRPFVLFERVTGELPLQAFLHKGRLTSQVLDDLRLLGQGLARIHTAGESYIGPPSLYRLDRAHLLSQPIEWIRMASVIDDALAGEYSELGADLEARLSEFGSDLSFVACHGDNHGGNTFISSDQEGRRIVSWFDFDDGGPGYLAYDLAVLLWQLLHRTPGPSFDEEELSAWGAFVEGYRSQRLLPDADFAAVALFVSIRHVFYLGEFASHLPIWGSELAPPGGGFEGKLAAMRGWAGLTTPV